MLSRTAQREQPRSHRLLGRLPDVCQGSMPAVSEPISWPMMSLISWPRGVANAALELLPSEHGKCKHDAAQRFIRRARSLWCDNAPESCGYLEGYVERHRLPIRIRGKPPGPAPAS